MGKSVKVTAQFYTKWGSLMQPRTYNSMAELKRAARAIYYLEKKLAKYLTNANQYCIFAPNN